MDYERIGAQRAFDEILVPAWYLVTQDAVPPRLSMGERFRATNTTVVEDVIGMVYTYYGWFQGREG